MNPYAKGEGNPKAKMTTDKVKEARSLYIKNARVLSSAHLAARFGLSWSGMKDLLSRRTWKHVR
jgi:hypothetical protein